jgi:thiol-disulfide isomerase/thioredoxin
MKIKDKIKSYGQRKSKFGIFSDIVFILLLIALFIPPSRTAIIVGIKRVIAFQPSIEKNTEILQENDYNWSIQNMDGQVIDFQSFKNEVIFLNTWATWCPHCIAEFPSIQKLYEEFGEKVKFIIISNESPQIIQKFMDKHGYTFPVYLTYNPFPSILKSRALPTTFIISKQGEIRINKKGSAKWNGNKIKDLLELEINK